VPSALFEGYESSQRRCGKKGGKFKGMETEIQFADSRKTYGNDRYVLAQLGADARLDWVAELRAFLIKPELKFRDFDPERHRVQQRPDLWRRVVRGVQQAEIYVTERDTYLVAAQMDFEEQGAEMGVDFQPRDVWREAGKLLVQLSPIGSLATFARYDVLSDNTTLNRATFLDVGTLYDRVGGKFNDAVVLATRADAALHGVVAEISRRDWIDPRTALYRAGGVVFDTEHSKSIALMNEVSATVGSPFGWGRIRTLSHQVAIFREMDTRQLDHLQAADMAAGWAARMLDEGSTYEKVASFFRSVRVNGRIV